MHKLSLAIHAANQRDLSVLFLQVSLVDAKGVHEKELASQLTPKVLQGIGKVGGDFPGQGVDCYRYCDFFVAPPVGQGIIHRVVV